MSSLARPPLPSIHAGARRRRAVHAHVPRGRILEGQELSLRPEVRAGPHPRVRESRSFRDSANSGLRCFGSVSSPFRDAAISGAHGRAPPTHTAGPLTLLQPSLSASSHNLCAGPRGLRPLPHVQVPEAKASDALAADVESCCCVCSRPWAEYRGQHKCAGSLPPPTRVCAVPVLVCTGCQPAAAADPPSLRCPLCQEGYVAPQARPALGGRREEAAPLPVDPRPAKRARPLAPPSSRLFVGGLPYLTNATAVRSALAAAAASGGADGGDHPLVAVDAPVDWLRDQSSGLFYGSARVQMGSVEAAEAAVRVAGASGLRMGKRKLRLNFAPVKEGEEWPSVGFERKERPPVG